MKTVWILAFLFFASLVTGSESRPSRARALRQLREQSRASQHLTCPCILILCRLRLYLLLKSCLQILHTYLPKKKLTFRQLVTLADQVNMAHGGELTTHFIKKVIENVAAGVFFFIFSLMKHLPSGLLVLAQGKNACAKAIFCPVSHQVVFSAPLMNRW